jgi:hypothetical protein
MAGLSAWREIVPFHQAVDCTKRRVAGGHAIPTERPHTIRGKIGSAYIAGNRAPTRLHEGGFY